MHKKLDKKLICKLLGISEKSYYRWKEDRKIFLLLEQCFSNSDLESFLATEQKPYKIEFADKYFVGLYEELSKFIVFNKGVKALFSAFYNNNNIISTNIEEDILKQYKESNLDNFDVVSYFNNKPSKELLLYIKENQKVNWDIYKNSVSERGHGWLVLYIEILLIAIEKNIYDKVFGQPNKENIIEECLVPPTPSFFGIYTNMYRIQEKYIQILSEVKEAIINNNYDSLPKYDAFVSTFDMNTEPLKTELEKALDDELYMGENK